MTGADTNTAVSVPAQSQPLELGSKQVSDLISSDVKIAKDGTVTGTLHHVESFPEFNESNLEEQSGNYFPITLDSKYRGKTISCQRNSDPPKESTDLWWILRVVDKNTTFTFKNVTDGSTQIVKLNFAKATLES